jgi:hypothetical protein
MPDPDKRKLRQLKKAIKKRGTKHRRSAGKQFLARHPDEAAEQEDDFGGYTSAHLNGNDSDSTRKRGEK